MPGDQAAPVNDSFLLTYWQELPVGGNKSAPTLNDSFLPS